jgi:hypothetical protein
MPALKPTDPILRFIPKHEDKLRTIAAIKKNYADVPLNGHPVILDAEGTLRFKPNLALVWVREHSAVNMNDIWDACAAGRFPAEDLVQFYRDIGYSLCGFVEVWEASNYGKGHADG